MNNFPVQYFSLTVLFLGITLCAFVQFAYIFFRIPGKTTLLPLLFASAAFLYVISDGLALVFTFITNNTNTAEFFVVLRDIVPLFFLIIIPFFLNQFFEIKDSVKKTNRILFWIAIISLAATAVFAAFKPGMVISEALYDNYGNPVNVFSRSLGTSPLLIARDILLALYSLYLTSVILFSEIQRKKSIHSRFILAGLIIPGYFAAAYLYSILFSNGMEPGNILYPRFSSGLITLIIFMSIGVTEWFAGNSVHLTNLKNNISQILYYDPLLNIPNRNGFVKDIQSKLNELETGGEAFSLIFIDIDDFSNLNACYGENTSNEILRMLSSRLNEYFSGDGTLYHTGVDEFTFLLEEAGTLEELKNLASRIITSFRNSFSISGMSYLVTASLGILQIPKDGNNIESIFNNAYSVIRSVKVNRNSFGFFNRELYDGSTQKIHIVNLLRNSIYRDQFTLFYQPIVNRDKKLIHVECLLRCTNNDPLIGGPGKFIPLIEEAGLTDELDNMVIRKAFRDMEVNIGKRFSVSINLSTNQLLNTNFSGFLSAFAVQHGIERQQVVLEVTENRLIKNLKAGHESLMNLKNAGFTIAIDDFGSGFSSLAYLAELPVDILKVDMVFIQSVPGNKKKEAMCRYIVDLAHSLNLTVVAEGFELPEQFAFFKELGCDLYQGYYFAKPMPLTDLLEKFPV